MSFKVVIWVRFSITAVHDSVSSPGENTVVQRDTSTSEMALTFSVILADQSIDSTRWPDARRAARVNRYMVVVSFVQLGPGARRPRIVLPGAVTRAHHP